MTSAAQRVHESSQRWPDILIRRSITCPKQRAEGAVGRDRHGDSLEERDQLRCLLKTMSETNEATRCLASTKTRQIRVRRRRHAIENAPDIGHHDVGAAIRECGRDQSGHFLIERIVVAKDELEWIGS